MGNISMVLSRGAAFGGSDFDQMEHCADCRRSGISRDVLWLVKFLAGQDIFNVFVLFGGQVAGCIENLLDWHLEQAGTFLAKLRADPMSLHRRFEQCAALKTGVVSRD